MADQLILEAIQTPGRPFLSLEFFPPKDEQAMTALRTTAERLAPLKPAFVTCTYGAGGSTRMRTLEVCGLLRDFGFGPVMPHLTCVGSSRDELGALVDEIHGRGYRNIMALRGDPPKGDTTFKPAPDGLAHASDLVAFTRARHPDMGFGVAAYPEVHPEAASAEEDLRWLKYKFDHGAHFATTQLFFDNRAYFDFVARARAIGISRPIVPGLLPAISLKQVQRMCAMCNTRLPPGLAQAMEEAGGDGEQAELAGIRWARAQIEDLLAQGAPGIHLYILNRSRAALSDELRRFFQPG